MMVPHMAVEIVYRVRNKVNREHPDHYIPYCQVIKLSPQAAAILSHMLIEAQVDSIPQDNS
jgi:hypothetical protein